MARRFRSRRLWRNPLGVIHRASLRKDAEPERFEGILIPAHPQKARACFGPRHPFE